MATIEVEGGGEGPAASIDLGAGTQSINVYLDGNIYLQNQIIDVPQENAETELALSFNVTPASGSGQCDESIVATASNGSGNYTYTVDNSSNLSNLCTGTHQLTAIDTETTCSITTTFTVNAQVGKPNHDIVTTFILYPNPFNDLVTITTSLEQLAPGDNSPIPVTISIYSSSGSHVLTVYSGTLAPEQTHTFPVDVSSFNSGTYIFTIEALGQGKSLMGVKN
ncbi:MAG: T9SS type A sorting domain-containing protein [Chitinophagales bacterium]